MDRDIGIGKAWGWDEWGGGDQLKKKKTNKKPSFGELLVVKVFPILTMESLEISSLFCTGIHDAKV